TAVLNILTMFRSEVECLQDLDEELYRTEGGKFTHYYTASDGWAPLNHYEQMKRINTEGSVYLCGRGIPHNFVLGKYNKFLYD
ncbi:hypothetical protein EV182_006120, partial [Spiromyces aspiralis]